MITVRLGYLIERGQRPVDGDDVDRPSRMELPGVPRVGEVVSIEGWAFHGWWYVVRVVWEDGQPPYLWLSRE